MTILQELAALYDDRAKDENWPQPGYSSEKIAGVVVLAADGNVHGFRSLSAPDNKGRMHPCTMSVPEVKRTAGIKPALFWDKTAYALGVTQTAEGPGQGTRTAREHEAFKREHIALLKDATDLALVALRAFCETWEPQRFADFPDTEMFLDQNLVFQMHRGPYLHEIPAAKRLLTSKQGTIATCLVSGRPGPVARLHPKLKGVMGAQSSGASLVSFNSSAYESHGKSQGDNAPVSEEAAFAYTTALNALLARGSGNSLRIGGDTVVFWADQPIVEDAFLALFSGTDDHSTERELAAHVRAIAEGRPARIDMDPDTRLFVLGLAPNAARLSVRYWYPGTLKGFADTVTSFWSECAISPSPFAREGVFQAPKPWKLLYDLAAQHDAKNIPHGLGGDLMRAILTGGRFPATLLTAILARLRVEGEPDFKKYGNMDGRRAAMIRAVIVRNFKWEVPMALDEANTNPAYLLGRLFGAYSYAETSYQDRGASLRQKYLAAASATPARVFPILMRGYEHNHDSLRKAGGSKAGAGVRADKAVAQVLSHLPADGLPASLPLEAQGLFFIGFYHQISAFYTKAEDALTEEGIIE